MHKKLDKIDSQCRNFIFLSLLVIIYKDNDRDNTMGCKLLIIYPVTITQRGAFERYVPSQGQKREKGSESGRNTDQGKTSHIRTREDGR